MLQLNKVLSCYLGNPCDDVSSNTDGQLGCFLIWGRLFLTTRLSRFQSSRARMKMPFYLFFVCSDARRQPEPDDLRFAFSGPDAANASSIQFPQGCL